MNLPVVVVCLLQYLASLLLSVGLQITYEVAAGLEALGQQIIHPDLGKN